jgi:opacity protein-like surface antigen
MPTVLTVLAVAVVAAVVTIASVVAAREDVRQATPAPLPSAAANPTSVDEHRIEFTTSTGSGVLEITDHGWDSDGSDTDEPGALLTVAVRISCANGTVRYGPDAFQAFDRSGDLFDPEVLADSPTALQLGTLSAGQQVTGTVAFDIPRGGVTLLMSDESSRTVTALRVPD